MRKRSSKSRGVLFYEQYYFVKQDPRIGDFLSEQKARKISDTKVRENHGPTPSCLAAWRKKKTRRCFHDTIVAAYRSIGLTLVKVTWTGKN